jgi:hypothetical protein
MRTVTMACTAMGPRLVTAVAVRPAAILVRDSFVTRTLIVVLSVEMESVRSLKVKEAPARKIADKKM